VGLAKTERSCFSCRVSKGEATREAVLEEALLQSSQVGLQGITIGRLADSTGMSKSGLFGHFRSKDQLQVAVLDHAVRRFRRYVVQPALEARPGIERLRVIFERWTGWGGDAEYSLPGGCVFITATYEFDDLPDGPVRDRVVQTQSQWLDFLAASYREGVELGELDPELDPHDFAHELYGLMLAFHVQLRLLKDAGAEARARRAFERLLREVCPQPAAT
jgi:AcrR family transcriptional regulator